MAETPPVETAPDGRPDSAPVRPRRRLRPALAALAVAVAAGLALLAVLRPATEPVAPQVVAEPAPLGVLPLAEDGGAGFAVEVAGLTVPYDTFALAALPGDTLALRARYLGGAVAAQATGGALVQTGPTAWTWTAPAEPGVSRLRVTGASADGADAAMTLHLLTLVPFDHSADAIGDFPIGDYADEPMGGDPIYDEPPGFIRVTEATADLPVSPHFRLGQFLAKQEGGWPKYLLVEPLMLLKLERLHAAVRAAGVPTQLAVLSGYRTPAYNASIGNDTIYSRHLYGDAADVYVDADGDGMMDDLDGDGEVTRADAEWLAGLAGGLAEVPEIDVAQGGVGVYGPAPHRGPFVHVDTRGQPVRW